MIALALLLGCGPREFEGCDRLPRPDAELEAIATVPLSEDFDLTEEGELVHVEQGNLIARSLSGEVRLISPNVTDEASGTRVLPGGDVLVSDVSGGQLWLVDAETGGRTGVLAAAWPNGLAVDSEGWVFVSDFVDQGRIVRIDPYDPSAFEIVAEDLDRPNGLALANGGDTLYVALTWADRIVRIDRTSTGWSEPETALQGTGNAQTLAVDRCDNLYLLGQSQIFRWAPGEDADELARTEGYMPSFRFGNGSKDFADDHLYGLSDGELWSYGVHVPGG